MSMKKKGSNPKRPGRSTKGVHNPLLPQELQGRRYAIKSFIVQPEITLYDADGKEERRFPARVNLAIYEASMGKTLPEVLKAEGLSMESDKP